jgi:hypothetical protein
VGREVEPGARQQIHTIQILGTLKSRDLAWISDDQFAFGHASPEVFENENLQPGDRLRARLRSYPWSHFIESIVPNSLVRNGEPRQSPKLEVDADLARVPIDAMNTWMESLRKGDIVLARIAYDGTGLPDRYNRIAKNRPAIFLRWEGDHAVVFPAYGKSGRIIRNKGRGVAVSTQSGFLKKTIILDTEYDVYIDAFVHRLGRLADADLKKLGLDLVPPLTMTKAPVSNSSPATQLSSIANSPTSSEIVGTDVDTQPSNGLEIPHSWPLVPAVGEEYVEPDVIILDQLSCAHMLGVNRLDLAESLNVLRGDGSAQGHIVGVCTDIGQRNFFSAARKRGWKTKEVANRDEFIRVAMDLSRSCEVVTLVSNAMDIIRELENNGLAVQFITDFQ